MTWTVPFNGTDIDIDPLTLDMRAWDDIEQRAGIGELPTMLSALFNFKPNAWRALYWAGARRSGVDPGAYGDFAGPTYGEILAGKVRLEEFGEQVSALLNPGGADPKAPASDG